MPGDLTAACAVLNPPPQPAPGHSGALHKIKKEATKAGKIISSDDTFRNIVDKAQVIASCRSPNYARCTQTHTHKHARTHTHTHAHTLSCMHARMHARTRSCHMGKHTGHMRASATLGMQKG